jgi:AcrR family transcriptional regulator
MRQRKPAGERKDQIAEITLEIIVKEGIEKFTTAEIAKRAEISEGAIFRHFNTKADIILYIIKSIEKKFFEGSANFTGDPIDRLGQFFKKRISVLFKNRNAMNVIFSDQFSKIAGKEGVSIIKNMRERSLKFVHSSLKDAFDSGLLKDGLDPDNLTVLILGSILSIYNSHLYTSLMKEKTLKKISAGMWETWEKLIRREL